MSFTDVYYDSSFLDGIRCQVLIDRNINNSNASSPRFIKRMISSNSVEFMKNVTQLHSIITNPSQRIYSSVNERNFKKATKIFKQKQLENEFMSEEQNFNFHKNIYNNWFSSLSSPLARKGNLFLLDFDSDDINSIEHEVIKLTTIKIKYKTKKGWHLIAEPFNTKLLSHPECEIKKDALLLIYYNGD